ncbi:MAG: hypothetical protein AAGM22_29360 [Acidobacteriota bacterium]
MSRSLLFCFSIRRVLPLVCILALALSGCDGDSPTEPQILAGFTFGGEGVVVEFFDASAGPVTQWLWEFGDEERNTSTLRNPVHRYQFTSPTETTEVFIVRLTVCETAERAADECSSIEKPVRVSDRGPPV